MDATVGGGCLMGLGLVRLLFKSAQSSVRIPFLKVLAAFFLLYPRGLGTTKVKGYLPYYYSDPREDPNSRSLNGGS